MTDEDDITYPSDWSTTSLSDIGRLDAALRCQICKDFFRTPMITGCSHTFCSKCIRRALSNDGRCPLCRSDEQEIRLRPNLSMQETVDLFITIRPRMWTLVHNGPSNIVNILQDKTLTRKRMSTAFVPPTANVRSIKKLRSSGKSSHILVNQLDTAVPEDGNAGPPQLIGHSRSLDSASGDTHESTSGPEMSVFCPICQQPMRQWQVFSHLDRCTGPPHGHDNIDDEANHYLTLLPRQSTRDNVDDGVASDDTNNRPMRLPAVNYSLMREQTLRKKLTQLGIPASGSKHVLEKRHREWLTIWNANCDKSRPKPTQDLLHELYVWERAQSSRSVLYLPTGEIRDKTFDGLAWSRKHDDTFKELIAKAKETLDSHHSIHDARAITQDEEQSNTEDNLS
jgi:E3 ubiquitin-protein ligase RAD18